MSTTDVPKTCEREVGALKVVTFTHPQGCRSYLLKNSDANGALVVDAHLDLVGDIAGHVRERGLDVRWVADTHTHADHPSGAGALAELLGAERLAHEDSGARGVTMKVRGGETLELGDVPVEVRHTPGHTPDHVVLVADGLLFSGDDYQVGLESTLGTERAENPWLQIRDRGEFVRALTANPPPEPANMRDLLRLNREGVDIPAAISVADAIERVKAGGAGSIIDVRTEGEWEAFRIPGSRWIVLDTVLERADEIRATPAPRLMLCHKDIRARMAREALMRLGVTGMTVVIGGLEEWLAVGGEVETGPGVSDPATAGSPCAAAAPCAATLPPPGPCAAMPPLFSEEE